MIDEFDTNWYPFAGFTHDGTCIFLDACLDLQIFAWDFDEYLREVGK
jgi:hypothetical protein